MILITQKILHLKQGVREKLERIDEIEASVARRLLATGNLEFLASTEDFCKIK